MLEQYPAWPSVDPDVALGAEAPSVPTQEAADAAAPDADGRESAPASQLREVRVWLLHNFPMKVGRFHENS